jgi:hypothetical protein
MTKSITDTDTLTADQQTALDLVEARPGLTVEDYADGDEVLCNAFYWLKYNRYIVIDPRTQAVTVKG